jgi:hypothetical protein
MAALVPERMGELLHAGHRLDFLADCWSAAASAAAAG